MLKQNDNDVINVPIVDGSGQTIPASSFTAARFVVQTFACQDLFSATLGSGITVNGDDFRIEVDPLDTNGPVSAEMRVWDANGNSNTIFTETLTIEQTRISRVI